MKVGFDIHGVIDTFPIFQELIDKMIHDETVEVHVISGLSEAKAEEEIGHLVDLNRIKYFSVTDYLMAQPDVEVKWINGLPWADSKHWDRVKADYCQRVGIDVLFDDSPIYAKHFDDIATVYCQIHNPNRKQYKTRPTE